MKKTGHYIVIEGADFTGKTTQMSLLKDYVAKNQLDVIFVREPGGTIFGAETRKLLFYPPEKISPLVELHLFTADRFHLWETVILPSLQAGKTVVSDRNWLSTLAYQGYGGKLPVQDVIDITTRSLPERYMHPDIVAVLEVDNEIRHYRKKIRPLESQKIDAFEAQNSDYFENVHNGYRHIVQKWGATRIDASGTPDEVFERILDKIKL